jgi:hypothetical protein
MTEHQKVSMTFDEIAAFKRSIAGDTLYTDRISIGLAFRLAICSQMTGDDASVLFEIEHLEKGIQTTTKRAAQFRHPPLFPLWHKHFFRPRHTFRNIGERWNIARGKGNHDLDTMIRDVALTHGHDPKIWTNLMLHRLVIGALEQRGSANRITGDWIIFAKHGGSNYYLDLATHEECDSSEGAAGLLAKIRSGSQVDFPFLFDHEKSSSAWS